MRTIIFQSDIRANDPVGGCYRIIRELQRLIEYNKAELDIVLHQLAICRAQAQQQQQQNQIQIPEPHPHALPAVQQEQQQQQVPYVFVQNNNINSPNSNSNNNNNNPHQHLDEDVDIWAMQDSMSSLDIKHGGGMNANDCEDLKPFVEIPCDDDQRNGEVRFQPEDIGDHQQRFVVPNTKLLISS
ncbi:LOB domain-containing protein 22 [Prunus yedoensis var. nudiflora]|uniref:LOB domain-containing protein 22 n=1 Tax=Prunus yedoensis var. nudiflora TaxID=2094558 RepID=A0A314YHL1_PRUYE|nr:LOB domain-containing protein 22 [Prunus yedoensis var. nudiflora]